MARSRQHGLTLLEVGTTTAIAALLVGTAAYGFRAAIERRRVEGIAAEVFADLQFARTEAVARNRGLRISFERGEDGTTCYVIHTGGDHACPCLSGAPAVCEDGVVEIKTVHLPPTQPGRVAANVASVWIDPLHGTASPTATVNISAFERPAVRHVVNLLGRVRTCTPPGGLPGHPAC